MHQRQYPGEVRLNPVQFGFFPVDIIHLLAKKNHFLLCFYLVDLEEASFDNRSGFSMKR